MAVMELYGLRGITHGWGRLLSVMSPAGARAVLDHVVPIEGTTVVAQNGQPVQYHQVRDGALDALVARFGIVELDQAAWAARKSEIGEAATL